MKGLINFEPEDRNPSFLLRTDLSRPGTAGAHGPIQSRLPESIARGSPWATRVNILVQPATHSGALLVSLQQLTESRPLGLVNRQSGRGPNLPPLSLPTKPLCRAPSQVAERESVSHTLSRTCVQHTATQAWERDDWLVLVHSTGRGVWVSLHRHSAASHSSPTSARLEAIKVPPPC